MSRFRPSFTTLLVTVFLLLLACVLFDFQVRGLQRFPPEPGWPLGDANAQRGKELVKSYGCGACHVIPGIRSATGRVGPKLEDFFNQTYIAGVIANTPENLIQWLQQPQEVNPLTVMPDLKVTEEDARDMAYYLYSR